MKRTLLILFFLSSCSSEPDLAFLVRINNKIQNENKAMRNRSDSLITAFEEDSLRNYPELSRAKYQNLISAGAVGKSKFLFDKIERISYDLKSMPAYKNTVGKNYLISTGVAATLKVQAEDLYKQLGKDTLLPDTWEQESFNNRIPMECVLNLSKLEHDLLQYRADRIAKILY